jgi:multicomponent Na+:H+ antiporter subunit G
MIELLLDVLRDLLLVVGLLVMTVGVVGMFRMPDIYLQLHAASKAVVLGVVAIAVASVETGDLAIIARAALISAFLLLTTPVAAHAIARAARGDEGAAHPQPADPDD